MVDINLSKAVRSNLSSLQNTASLMSKTSDRLSTGNKVNSALDNPTNFFTASSLNSRAGDLNQLMDSMANGIKTIEAADNGLTAITKNLESMQSTLRQARQDKTFQTATYTVPTAGTPTAANQIDISGGAFGATATLELSKSVTTGGTTTPASAATISGTGAYTPADVSGGDKVFSLDIGNGPVDITLTSAGSGGDDAYSAAELQTAVDTALGANMVTVGGGTGTDPLTFTTVGTGAASEITIAGADVADFGFTAADTDTGADAGTTGGTTAVTWKSVDELVSEINSKFQADGTTANPMYGKIRASNDKGNLRIENLSTQDLSMTGISTSGAIDGTTTAPSTISGNSVRSDLATQFNELRDQLDKLADDASFNGINLLRGDNLKITFNETGTSSIDIQTKNEQSVNSANLGVSTALTAADLDNDANIDTFLDSIKTALGKVRSQSSTFGSNLSVVQNRQDFTKSMINTLETGAGNLTLADMNQEAANMMALQTRQSLASSTLSMANQADQGVLQLLR